MTMDTKRSTALAAVIAAIAALTLISAAVFSGTLLTTTTSGSQVTVSTLSTSSQSSQQTSQTSTQSTQQSASQQSSTQSTSQQSSTQQSSSQQGQGTLSILLTDPPTIPAGVSDVYVTYADLAVHLSGKGNDTGWTVVRASGSIDLLGAVNVSETISSSKISVGTYNMIRFAIASSEVTYYGKNYTAFVQTSELTVPIVGDIGVVASTPSAAIIDISPTVINTGTQSAPEFIILSVAFAYPVPSSVVTVQQEQVGSQETLVGASWWQDVSQTSTAHLSIDSASLNETYLNLGVSNTGGNSTLVSLVTITPVVSPTAVGQEGVIPTALGQSAIFVVLSNGTLVQMQACATALTVICATPLSTASASTTASTSLTTLFSARGLELPSGATATLTHSHGTIILGFAGAIPLTSVGKITKGQQYLVTVIGTETSASLVVTAS